MMLATRCPYCHTSFRVVQDQLKIFNGIVRCGSCKQVFNGTEQLIKPEEVASLTASAAPSSQVSWPESAIDTDPITVIAVGPAHAEIEEPVEELQLILTPSDTLQEPVESALADTPNPVFGDEMETAQQVPAPEEEDEPEIMLNLDGRIEPHLSEPIQPYQALHETEEDGFDGDVEFTLTHSPVVQDETSDEAPMPDVAKPAVAEPGFMQRARRQERYGRIAGVAKVLLILILLPLLFFQTVDAFNDRLAATFPQLKPMLEQVCEVIECQTALQEQIDMISVDVSELQAPTANEKSFTLNMLLRNRSALAQAWPYLELTLNDANETPLVRRVFTAQEYLASVPDAPSGFAANSEQQFKLAFDLEQPKPSGYRVYLFYP